MIFYPKDYFKSVTEITYSYLKEKGIQALILDVDNTLIDYHKTLSPEIIEWSKSLQENGIKMFILSNSNKQDKVKNVARQLNLEYIYFGMKPFKMGFKKAKERLKLDNNEIGVVGDQIFTDVIGANRMKMYSILVEPIMERDILITLIKRPLENYIKKQYLKQRRKNDVF